MNVLRIALNSLKRERMNLFAGALLFAVIVAIVLINSACTLSSGQIVLIVEPTATPNPIPALSQNIPGYVEGTIIDKPTRDWSADPARGMFRFVVHTSTGDVTTPVDVETFVRYWQGDAIKLDCSQMPCIRVGLVTGKVIDAPQTSWTITLDINGTQRVFDVDPTVSLSVKVGQIVRLDCADLPCKFAEGEGQ